MRTARCVPVLLGGAAAVLAMAAGAAGATPAGRHNGNSTGPVSAILRPGDIVTGVRGTTNGNVVLTGSAATGNGMQTAPFLYRGHLTRSAEGAAVSVLRPPFPGVTTGTLYGPDTHSFNPGSIPKGKVRAVGSYQSS